MNNSINTTDLISTLRYTVAYRMRYEFKKETLMTFTAETFNMVHSELACIYEDIAWDREDTYKAWLWVIDTMCHDGTAVAEVRGVDKPDHDFPGLELIDAAIGIMNRALSQAAGPNLLVK